MSLVTAKKKPTDAELAILHVLWARGPSTVREVATAMDHQGAYTTVLKLLQIMAAKGLVRRNEADRSHVYEAADSQDHTEKQIVREVLQKVFDGSAAKLVMQALSSGKVSAGEISEIRRLLNNHRGGRS